ncbi:MAG: hypothetical protein PF569_02125 [Candidatus Woesearchaeota archaeon]|nr:hypothetical protein [Candidatus Woesearchaeota archaeon]
MVDFFASGEYSANTNGRTFFIIPSHVMNVLTILYAELSNHLDLSYITSNADKYCILGILISFSIVFQKNVSLNFSFMK